MQRLARKSRADTLKDACNGRHQVTTEAIFPARR